MSKSVWYTARHIIGSGMLANTWDTFTEAKNGIDKANERAVSKGFTASSYLITKTECFVEFTKKGKFKSRTVTETAIQTYPKEMKGDAK